MKQNIVNKKHIVWVTAEYFLDVDIPIITYLKNTYRISWFILSKKELKIDNIKKGVGDDINITNTIIQKHWVSPASFFEFYTFFKIIRKLDSDLYYLNLSSLSYTYLAIKKAFKECHNVILAAHNVSTPKGARFEFLAKLNMGYLLKHFTNIHVFSRNQKEILLKKYSNKNILCAPLALKDYGRNNPNEGIKLDDKGAKTFLFFGHIASYKRLDVLIEAAQQLFEKFNVKINVIIAGKCNNWELYEKKIRYKELFILKLGFVPNDEIAALFEKIDYMVLPYQDLAQSGALMVAFNYHKPVICSDIDQFKEFVEDKIDGYIFKSNSVESLVEILHTATLETKEEYLNKVNNIQKKAENIYSPQSICNSYIQYFNSINSYLE